MLRQRREAYRETLREDILDAARQLFVRQGYDATSIRAIATKVGASPGILYHYFEDKQAIMAHLVRETFHRLHARLESIRLDSAPAPDRLRRGLRAYIEFGLQHPHHYMVLFMKPENFDGNEKIKEAFQTEGMQTFGCLEAICAECIQLGCLRPEVADHRELAQSLWMGIHGFVSAQIGCAGFPFLERNRLIDRLLDILLTGIVRKP